MGRSRKRKNNSPGTTCSTAKTSMRRSSWRRFCLRRSMARSKYGPSSRCRGAGSARPRARPHVEGSTMQNACHEENAVAAAIDSVFREDGGRLTATLIRVFGDFDLAEDALQEAAAAALTHWSRDGVPGNPAGWLFTAARRSALDRVRRDATLSRKLQLLVLEADSVAEQPGADMSDSSIEDDRLRLIFTCCHPALAPEARVALTLRTLCGLSTAEIARAFLVPEATMAQRLVRAKHKIRAAGIPYRVPEDPELPARLDSVLGVIYLIFNEGYSATNSSQIIRSDLCGEAIRLARLLAALMPDEPEVFGLLALCLLHDSRRATRQDGGRIVLLDQQDRWRWD